jgi:hypothetical protein
VAIFVRVENPPLSPLHKGGCRGIFFVKKCGFDTGWDGIRKKAGNAPAFQYPREGSRNEEEGGTSG